ncbi:MAG: hypothetical protein AAFN81_17660, partial [Bacteroidota bacterium]
MPEHTVITGQFDGVTRKEIFHQYLPQPDQLLIDQPTDHTVLIVHGKADQVTVNVLQQELSDQGFPVLHLSIDSLIQDPQAIDEAIGTKLTELQTAGKVIKSFIYLHPQFEFQTGRFAEHFSVEKMNVQIPFFAAKHLQAKLNELGTNERVNFTCFTQLDGQMGWGRRGNTSIVGRG